MICVYKYRDPTKILSMNSNVKTGKCIVLKLLSRFCKLNKRNMLNTVTHTVQPNGKLRSYCSYMSNSMGYWKKSNKFLERLRFSIK